MINNYFDVDYSIDEVWEEPNGKRVSKTRINVKGGERLKTKITRIDPNTGMKKEFDSQVAAAEDYINSKTYTGYSNSQIAKQYSKVFSSINRAVKEGNICNATRCRYERVLPSKDAIRVGEYKKGAIAS